MLKEKTMKSNKANLDALMEAYKSMQKDEDLEEGIFGKDRKITKLACLKDLKAARDSGNAEKVNAALKLCKKYNVDPDLVHQLNDEGELEEDYAGAVSYVRGMRDHLEAMFVEIQKQPEENQRDIFEIIGKLFMRAAQQVN